MKNSVFTLTLCLLSTLALSQNPSCSCTTFFIPQGNCCYDIEVDFMGTACAGTTVPTLALNSAVGPNATNILSLTAEPGFVANNSLTTGQLSTPSSFSTLPSYPAKVGTICLTGGAPIALVTATLQDAAGNQFCQSFNEVMGDCQPPQPPGPPDYFDKLYGGNGDDRPEEILITTRGEYLVIGNQNVTNGERGTLALIDPASTSVLWQYVLPTGTLVSDVTEDPGSGEIYVVLFDTQIAGGPWLDNKSGIIKLSQTGQLLWERRFEHTGRERMRKVYFNPSATATGAGIFVVGARNPSLPASGVDEPIVYLFDTGGNIQWSRVIPEGDLEAYRGIVDVGFGSHVILGNDANGRGAIYEIQSGGFSGVRRRFDDAIDWYHGVQLPSSNYLWVGQQFVDREAVLMVTDQSLTVLGYYKVPEIEKFEVVYESQGRFYTVGQLKNDPTKRNVIVGIRETPNALAIDLARRIDDGTSLRQLGKLHILEGQTNYIGFAEALTPSNGYGQLDMHLAIYDRAISGTCVSDVPLTLQQATLSTQSLATLTQNLSPTLQPPIVALRTSNNQCQPACSSPPPTCDADFTWVDNGCGEISFMATPLGTAPFTFAWDFVNGGTTQSTIANPTWNYGINGANPTVCLDIIDAAGCADRVCKPITVAADRTPPTLTCRADTTLNNGSLCAGGAFFVHDPGMATDDCDTLVMITHTQTVNNFYPCGTTTVTVTATDDAGNVSTCSYQITVNCPCAEVDDAFMECTNIPDEYYFEFTLNDLTGGSSCSITNLSYLPANVVATGVQTVFDPVRGQHYVRGNLSPIAGTSFPPTVVIDADIQCVCPDGSVVTCTRRITIQTPCCKEASLADQALCRDASQLLIDVDFFGSVPLSDIVKIDYWVAPGPCAPGVLPQGQPYQSSRPYRPLLIIPSLMPSNDLCIYAEVYLSNNQRPCTVLRTNLANIELCDPVGISLSGEQLCAAQGTQVQPSTLTFAWPSATGCYDANTVRWYRNGTLIPGATGNSLQPAAITNNMQPLDCELSETYRVEFDGTCGLVSASATITLFNQDADVGDLYLDPFEATPFCPGEDASIRFDDNCATTPLPGGFDWRWTTRTQTTSYGPLAGSGTKNPYWNTNRLFEDTYYRVERQNGTCPVQSTELLIPVIDPISIVNFNVKELDVCRETGTRISVNFDNCPGGVCPCPVVVEYYYNDNLIHTSTNTTGADFYDFMSPASDVFCGNYYVILRSTCCDDVIKSQVETFGCPIDLAASGNCYCCANGEPLLLQGFPINVDPVAAGCTFQWYLWDGTTWNPISGATSAAHAPSGFGRFKLVMDCGGCIKEAEHEIIDCGCNMASSLSEVAAVANFEVFPNPTSAEVNVRFELVHGEAAAIELRDMTGRLLQRFQPEADGEQQLQLLDIQPGAYLISLITAEREVVVRKLMVN